MSREDGLRYCLHCKSSYLGGWCPVCTEADAYSLPRSKLLASVVRADEFLRDVHREFKVPAPEAVMREGEGMSLQETRVYGVPPVIGQILADHPDGLSSLDVLSELKTRGVLPAHRNRQTVTLHLGAMRDSGLVAKKSRANRLGGPLWSLTGKTIKYSATGEGKRKKKVAKELAQLRKAAAVRPAMKKVKDEDAFAAVQSAISDAISSLQALADSVANIETREFKLKQREEALNAAKKLLGSI